MPRDGRSKVPAKNNQSIENLLVVPEGRGVEERLRSWAPVGLIHVRSISRGFLFSLFQIGPDLDFKTAAFPPPEKQVANPGIEFQVGLEIVESNVKKRLIVLGPFRGIGADSHGCANPLHRSH